MKNKRLHYSILIIASLGVLLWAYNAYHTSVRNKKSAAYLLDMFNDGEQIRLGSAESDHTLVLFYDYECPICRRFFNHSLPILQAEIESEQLSILLKPVNLNGDASRSEAYNLLYCLNRIDLFQDLHEVLLIEPNYMYHQDFLTFKEELFREQLEIQACVESFTIDSKIENNKLLLKELGFKSLPLYLIGNRTYNGHLSPEKIKRLIK